MDNFYYVPHVSFKQDPAPFPDWNAGGLTLQDVATKCENADSCVGFDTGNNVRDASATKYSVLHYADADKGSYLKGVSEAEELCNTVGGTLDGKRCTGADATKAQTWVSQQNDVLSTLWGPPAENFIGALEPGMRIGLCVAALVLILWALARHRK